jgi:RNA polymerase sigma factor (sigma-70 family)
LPDKDKITPLVRAAQTGDELAFAELVRLYQDIAVAYATSILGNYHLAEDAAQEAFVEVHQELPNLREPAAFAAWLRLIVFKHCDRLTRRKQHPLTDLEAALDVVSTEPSAHERLELRAIQQSVREALAALSDTERQVVLLYYMGEHSTAAIAAFLEITINAVKTRLYAARKRLKKRMGHIEENLNAARPSSDAKFTEKVQRMIRPDALKKTERLYWSPGIGADVWEMFCACITGELETVKRLVEKDPSLVCCHYEYRTPLSFAARENQVEIAAFLLDHGAAPFGVGGDLIQVAQERGYAELEKLLTSRYAEMFGASTKGDAVAAAIRARDPEQVRKLLDESPELLHAGDKFSNQPIHWAVMSRQLDLIDELLAQGADINARRGDGARPLQLINGDYNYRGWRDVPQDWPVTPGDVYQHLVARGAYVDIGMAAAKGDLARVRELLEQDPSLVNRVADYNSYYVGSGAPLKNAALGGNIEIVKLLLDYGADPNLPEEGIAPRGHALHTAVCRGHIEIVRLLLEHGAYPNVEVESSADTLSAALGEAGYSTTRNQEMVDLLCSYGAARPVHLLAHCHDLQTAAAVFAANPALADDTDALGSAGSHEGFIRLMLRYQPDLPKRRAIGGGTREITELLFKHGMDPNQPNWLRITPLHHFAASGDVQNAAIFIEHGADVNAREEEFCSTPLGWAARCGKTRMVELLLRAGASLNLPDDPPWATPLAWATRRGYEEIVRILTEYEKTGALPVHRLEEYEAVARDFIEAYQSGEAGEASAMRRIWAHFQVPRIPSWEEFREGVQKRLGVRAGVENVSDDLSLENARFLVARLHGFESWELLAKYLETH